ncbi:hypothetical protein ACLMJK_002064 [Lecanora helva]
MDRQERPISQAPSDLRRNSEIHRGKKTMPSGSQLPSCWNNAMDRAICHMEAQNEVTTATMTRLLKRRFPELEGMPSSDALKHSSFKTMITFNLMEQPMKSDEEVFGLGGPMPGTLGFGASNVIEPAPITRRTSNLSIRGKAKVPGKDITLAPAPTRQASARNEGIDSRRVRLGKAPSNGRAKNYDAELLKTAGDSVNPHNLTDISNTYNATGTHVHASSSLDRSPPALANTKHKNATITPVPSAPVNPQGAQAFPSPGSSNRRRGTAESTHTHGSHHHSTPTSRDKSHSKDKISRIPTPGAPSGGLYRSGMENSTSGMSTSTTGTSVLGREISGMANVMERRQFKIDNRLHAND